jgi:hypothetical protein
MVFGEAAYEVTCNTGVARCEEVGGSIAVTTCEGWLPLAEEVCDAEGVDEDCNGVSNNLIYEYYDPKNTCTGTGECRYQTQFCDAGEMVCVPISDFYGPEVCDGRDNDCDGDTDGEDDDLVYAEEFQYSGDPDTLNVGECRAGVNRCENGLEYFFGEVLPTEEICGNGDDDDCDGFTDEDDNDSISEAFLVVIDFSGSMSGTIDAVIDALCGWSDTNTFTNSLFAIQVIGTGYVYDPYILNLTGFVPASTACNALTTFRDNDTGGGGLEYVPYGIWAINNDPALRLTWPEAMRRRVVFFTDEGAQGYLDYVNSELRNVAADCVENKYSVGGFVTGDYAQWRLMTDPCLGWLEHLSDDPVELRDDLNRRFGSGCGE